MKFLLGTRAAQYIEITGISQHVYRNGLQELNHFLNSKSYVYSKISS